MVIFYLQTLAIEGCVCVCVYIARSCLTHCDPMDYSQVPLSVDEIFQARILEWVAIPFSIESSWFRDWTQISCIAGRFFKVWATRQAIEEEWGSNLRAYHMPVWGALHACHIISEWFLAQGDRATDTEQETEYVIRFRFLFLYYHAGKTFFSFFFF